MAYHCRGQVLAELGQVERAIQDYEAAIRLDPDFALAFNKSGIAFASLGQHQRFLQDYNDAVRLESGSALAYRNR